MKDRSLSFQAVVIVIFVIVFMFTGCISPGPPERLSGETVAEHALRTQIWTAAEERRLEERWMHRIRISRAWEDNSGR